MTLIATAGSPTANSYLTLAEADVYFANRLNSDAWDDSPNQDMALIEATFRLDQYDYLGITTDEYLETPEPTQALKWPRVLNDDGDLIRNYSSLAVPLPIKYATAELALSLLSSSSESVAAGAVESLKIGTAVEVKYSSGSTVVDTSVDWSGLPIQAARFLKGLRLIPVLA